MRNPTQPLANPPGYVRVTARGRTAGARGWINGPTRVAKFKPARSRKAGPGRSNKSAIPCLVLVLAGIALISFLFYEILKSGS